MIRKLAKLAVWPSEKASELVGKFIPHKRRTGKVCTGIGLMIGASQMATSYPVGCWIPHALYDALAYLIHAIGSAPVIEAYCEKKQERKAQRDARRFKSTGQHHNCSAG